MYRILGNYDGKIHGWLILKSFTYTLMIKGNNGETWGQEKADPTLAILLWELYYIPLTWLLSAT